MTLRPDLLRRSTLRDDVARYVREMIFAGAAHPGEVIRIAPLAEQLGVSMTPVREALLSLAQSGLIHQEINKAFRVNHISRRDIEDTYLVHEFTAGELTARAALDITADRVQRLNNIDEQINSLDASRQREAEDLNTEFHQEIYRCSDSTRLKWFEAQVDELVPRHFWSSLQGWFELNRTGHRPIILALEAHEPQMARLAMQTHLHAAGQLLLKHIDALAENSDASPTDD